MTESCNGITGNILYAGRILPPWHSSVSRANAKEALKCTAIAP